MYNLTPLLFLSVVSRCFADDVTYLSEYYSTTPQKLSTYNWYGSVRLFPFTVPEGSLLASWFLTVTKAAGSNCGDHNISIHVGCGAPPLINPLHTAFPPNTTYSPAHNLTLTVSTAENTTMFNISNPQPGPWFVAAHLPKDDGRIVHQGFTSSCSYLFQPRMFVRRMINIPILETNATLQNNASTDNPAYVKVFVPEYTSQMSVSVWGCVTQRIQHDDCSLTLTLGSAQPSRTAVKTVNCSSGTSCSVTLHAPPWHTWVRVCVESTRVNISTSFFISATLTESCKPQSSPLTGDFFPSVLNVSSVMGNTSVPVNTSVPSSPLSSHTQTCLHIQPLLKEEQDVVSVQFSLIGGPNLTVWSTEPTLLQLDLNSVTESGGTLNLELTLNQTNMTSRNASVSACLTVGSPFVHLSSSESCSTAFWPGYDLNVNVDTPSAVLRIPYPQTGVWYLTLQTLCTSNSSECENVSLSVMVSAYLSACIDECGTYGECRLLRSYSYLYAACVCKAGRQGWGCTDESSAQSYGRQMTAALLLTLSNLLFIPPILVALHRSYMVEASVYIFTMFFSTFYHACDQPGVTVMCIMEYDTLQYCDFLGSVTSIWVTLLCMARVHDKVKYTLFLLGTLVIAMSMQLDRRGLWNMVAPVLCAALTMVTAWVYRGVKRKHCYPTSWRRWLFFLAPGLASAFIGLCVFVFAETDDNYYYTHSMWHVLVASSVVFLLPPREAHQTPWGWNHKFCTYHICKNEKEELYTVT